MMVWLAAVLLAARPSVTLPRTEVRELRARSGIAYKLYVSTPPGYARTGKYPVVYLLDADYSFAVAKNITDHLTQRNHLPDVLVVGIAYDGVQTYPQPLTARQVQGLALKLVPLDDETHNSVFPAALGKGLRWIFDSP